MADDDDDPQLRSMRAAWRSLPDEDPPQRGLSELMAAARQQAAVMAEARVPWWRRLLMRPSVLALATVLILLGGVFAVTASKKAVSSEPTPIEQPAQPAPEPAEAPPPHASPPSAPPVQRLQQSATPQPPRPSPTISAPVHHSAPAKAALQPPPPPPASPPAGNAIEAEGDDGAAPAARGALGKASVSDTRRQLDAQLFAQCQAAAARGDCETAKKIAQRIQTDDADYFAQTVAPDDAIAKCLRE